MDETMENEKEENKIKTKEEKLLEIEDVLRNIENGFAETYKNTNPSPVWKKFMLIRIVKTKKRIEFAQCSECKTLLAFKQYSGTSHLKRHKCRIDEDVDEDGPKYRTLPAETAAQIRDTIINNVMKYCAVEFVTCKPICDSVNFVEFVQSFVSLTLKYGSVCIKDLFPNSNTMVREIAKFKNEKQEEIYRGFRQAMNKECCSASLELRSLTNSKETSLLVMRLQYFENDFSALKSKVIFGMPFDGKKPDIFWDNFIKQFKVFGGDETDLQRMMIVTPNHKFFRNVFKPPFSQANCIANIVLNIVNQAFEDDFDDEITDFFSNCRDIVQYISKSKKYNFEHSFDNDTWKDRLLMIESINENYNHIVATSKEDSKFDFNFNIRRSEELVLFLEPFVEAIDVLSATSCTTANKIFLWWAILNQHLQSTDDYSNVLKEIMQKAMNCLQSTFSVTMDDKINCFLDPRYKLLKMLTENERVDVMKAVSDLLKNMQDKGNDESQASTSTGLPKAKRGRFTHFESDASDARVLPTAKSKGKNRFMIYEANEADMEENDEVRIYLKLPIMNSSHFKSEFDLIKKFWKSKRDILPKLFRLATTRLHIPAHCGSVGQTNIILKEDLKDEVINELLLIKDNI